MWLRRIPWLQPMPLLSPQVFPLPALSRKQRTVLVVCGPEHNGAVGLVCARHLRVFVSSRDSQAHPNFVPVETTSSPLLESGDKVTACPGGSAVHALAGPRCPSPPQEYEPTIFYPTRSLDLLHRDLTTQCEKMDIPFLSYLPTEVRPRARAVRDCPPSFPLPT